MTPDEMADALGIDWFDYQVNAFEVYQSRQNRRLCLFFRTGAGKTLTSLGCLRLDGYTEALVLAPLSTVEDWEKAAAAIGISVTIITHQKFLQSKYEVPKIPIVVDEFHMLGGLKGVGWKKLRANTDRRDLPLIVMSATPFWNSAERVFCAKRVIEGYGDYQTWLMNECLTEPDRYSILPRVLGFRNHPTPADWLDAQPWVCYLPDTREIDVLDVAYEGFCPDVLDDYGFDVRRRRIVASIMEEKHVRKRFNLIDDDGFLRDTAWDQLIELAGQATGPVLLYCDSSQVAQAVVERLVEISAVHALLTGDTPKPQAREIRQQFREGKLDVLVGTATMRTGTDGFDKVCDTLIIVDDTTDDAAREQLIGRILPRGVEAPIDNKRVWRLVAT